MDDSSFPSYPPSHLLIASLGVDCKFAVVTIKKGHFNVSVQVRALLLWLLLKRICFYIKELLAPRRKPKLEDHSLSAVRDCLFNIFASTLHTGGRSSIRNLRTCHAEVIGTHSSCGWIINGKIITLKSISFLRSKKALREVCYRHSTFLISKKLRKTWLILLVMHNGS